MEEATDATNNWGRWGDDDELGSANLLTSECVQRATSLVTSGQVLSLSLPIRAGRLPVFGGRPPIVHTMRWDGGDYAAGAKPPGGSKSADDYLFAPVHGTTHIDSLSHAWYDTELFNGVPESEVRSSGARKLGAEKIPPLVTRGVLVDARRYLEPAPQLGDAITRAQIESTLKLQDVSLRAGDVVLVRTGWLEDWRQATEKQEPMERQQGLDADTAELWADADVVAVGADNCTVEVWPDPAGRTIPLHRRMLRDYGIFLMELLDLEELAESGRFEFLFVASPLPIVGGTGSPLNPLAVL